MPRIHVLYENEDWLPPLTAALDRKGVPYTLHFTDGGSLDLSEAPPPGVWLNRMSPSSHTRGHQDGVIWAREAIAWLEAHGRRVINGTRAFALEVSKVRQHAALEAFGIATPHTIAVVGTAGMKEAARRVPLPFITKHNQGGKGLGVMLYRDLESFDRAIDDGAYEPSPDGINLVQAYIEPREPFITRVEIVDGRFLYAIRSSTEQGFELCPADACAIDDAFCPTDGSSGSADGRFRLREDITADDPLVLRLIDFCAHVGLDVAGIEFVEGTSGQRFVYDINGTTNFNSDVESAHGLDGMGAITDLANRLIDSSPN